MEAMKKIVKERPAESTTAVAGALAAIFGPLVGLNDTEEVAALAVVLGAIPAIVTWIVDKAREVAA